MVYFAFMILQGLRYLKDYQIAHLDLKLANIMIGSRLVVKIIDFGESYHPSMTSS
jgi:serine/threonine protein kinase